MRRRYASNTGLLILNKWLLSSYGFRRPVFLTLCHMLACSAAGYGVSAGGLVPSQPVRSPEQFRKIAALACVFCLSVVLGNVALRFIPVSFSQAPPFPPTHPTPSCNTSGPNASCVCLRAGAMAVTGADCRVLPTSISEPPVKAGFFFRQLAKRQWPPRRRLGLLRRYSQRFLPSSCCARARPGTCTLRCCLW